MSAEDAGAPRAVPWCQEDDDAWDALCERHGDLFQTSAVTRAGEVRGVRTLRVRIEDASGAPVCALALLEAGSRRLPAADRAFTRTFHVHGGPLPLAPDADLSLAAAGVEGLAAERGAVETEWKPTWPAPGRAAFAGTRWETREVGLAWRTLPADPQDVMETLSRAHRKAVRRALREGVEVRETGDLGEILPLVDVSFRRSGLPPRDREFLHDLHRRLTARGAAVGLVAEAGGAGGEPLAALLAARCGDALFNLFHGRVEGDSRGASNLLHLRLLELGSRGGMTRVHTGDALLPGEEGTPSLQGITRFKEHLGFGVEACPRGTCVHRPLGRRVRRAALGVYRLLRGGLS